MPLCCDIRLVAAKHLSVRRWPDSIPRRKIGHCHFQTGPLGSETGQYQKLELDEEILGDQDLADQDEDGTK
jgi:hypothetical protein